ncbi:Hsp70-like protein [Nemania sp. FL0916]|nr:Hsp70-like protein [Nemania sp. FL0916]
MNSLNSRLKVFKNRRSNASISPSDNPPANPTPPPQITQAYPPGATPPQLQPPTSQPGPAPTGVAIASSSQAGLPIMNHPGAGPRPPSYTSNFQQGPQAPIGRTSPLTQNPTRTPPTQMVGGPPPINTGAPVAGYPPPPMRMQPGAQPAPGGPGGPPGYPPAAYPQPAPTPQQQPTNAMSSYGRPAAEVEGNSRSKAQLIVGIDFGTTFSGVAFAFATNNEAKEDIITEWPGAGSYTKQKIPTVLYYDQYQKVVGWGPDIADALAPTGYPKPGVQKVEWFKLQLMLSGNTYIDPINLPPLPPGKSEIDVAADYLFKLRQAMRAALQKTLGEVFNREERNIRYYLTVPAIWNDAGKAATRAAAIQAGFLRDENDNRLTLVSEPEAASLFCAKTGLLNLKVHDAILIVDCGGGTVDLIAYEVEDENPFTVAECTAGSGDSCGSTALNRNFSNILRTKIRKMKLPDGSKTAGRVYAKCIMDFENRIKADFRNNGQKWAVDVGIEAEFPEAGIEEGYMTFTNEEILQCFEPVVNRILELVRNQIIAIQAQNRTLQNILVVGGFGASEYLFQQIKLHVPPQFQSKVVRPMDSVAAIVKGAVTAGITERVITHRVARRHYLMATLQPFKEGYHPEAYRVPSLDGKDRCKFTRQIFVQKGQKVKIGEPVKVSFFRQVAPGATLMYEDILHACDEDVCPEYTKDPRIKEVVTLTSDLSRKNLEKDFERMDTPQGTFYRVYFDIYLTLDGSEFSAELVCQGEPISLHSENWSAVSRCRCLQSTDRAQWDSDPTSITWPLTKRDAAVPLIVTNNCQDVLWPGLASQAGEPPESHGFELGPGKSRNLTVGPTWAGRVWARTNCTVGGNTATCQTGDCLGKLDCVYGGDAPATLAEFNLAGGATGDQTFYDISLVDGYNLPLGIVYHPADNTTFIPPNLSNPTCIATSGFLSMPSITGLTYTNDTYPMPYQPTLTNQQLSDWCPWDLQAFPPEKPGDGVYPYPDDNIQRPIFDPCLSACASSHKPKDCCTGKYNGPDSCNPSTYSKYAKIVCPDAYSYAFDDKTSTFTVPIGGGWEVVFCPKGRSTNILATFSDELNYIASSGAVTQQILSNAMNVSFIESKHSAASHLAGPRRNLGIVFILMPFSVTLLRM